MEEKKEKTRYWLKLEKNFLDSKYIKIIKNVPNGKDYILFYIALMLESVDSVGHLRFTDLVPYNEQMLSSLTDTNIDIVRSAMKMFQELGLITVLADGTIFLPEVPKLTGKESESAERVRRFRKRKEQEALQCNTSVTTSNDNIDKEKDKQSTENKEEIDEFLTAYNNISSLPKAIKLTETRKKHIQARIKEHGLETCIQALDKIKASDFLSGKNNQGWKPNLDWIVNQSNMIKILEGAYDNKKGGGDKKRAATIYDDDYYEGSV
jgi:predicted phage replisome organizer